MNREIDKLENILEALIEKGRLSFEQQLELEISIVALKQRSILIELKRKQLKLKK